ncbi:MAG TPA: hypothetical protein VGL04_07870 [Sporichthyaceae bacterium]|jgi:hypothetical protein
MTPPPAGISESSPSKAPRRRRKLAILLPVLLAVGAIFGVGAAAYSRGAEDDTAARPAGVSNPLAQPNTPTKSDDTTDHSADAAIGQAPIKISIGKLLMSKDATGLQQTSLPVTVTNTGPLTHSFDITIAAYTKDGQRITMDTGTAANLRPGQVANLRVLEIVNDKLVAALQDARFQIESVFTY